VRRTILAASNALAFGDAQTRSFNFSNPNVLLNGVATGTADNDNSRTINNALCEIQYFRPPAGLSVRIGGQTLLCGFNGSINGPAIFTAHVTQPGAGVPGGPPYSYRWQWNSTGVFSFDSPVIGTGPSINIQEVFSCPNVYLRVVVQSQADPEVIAVDIFNLSTALCYECVFSQPLVATNSDNTADYPEVRVFPNPTNDFVSIRIVGDNHLTNGKLRILNSSGLIVYNQDIVGSVHDVNVSSFPSGLYIVDFLSLDGSRVRTKLLIMD
jgi:hypothetical protein